MKKKPPKILDYYVLIHSPTHERAVGEGYVPEQVLVAEKALGRGLTADEEVRHINGNPYDNRPANLEIISANAGFRTQFLGDETDEKPSRGSTRTFIPCRYQRVCWKTVRAPIAKKHGIYLPYHCSFQTEGDIYKCSHFWKFLEAEMEEKKEEERGSV